MKLSLYLFFFILAFDASAETKTMGHIASFFKQSERPSKIVDYIDSATSRLKIDEMYPNLLQLESNYFAFGFWTEEERSIHQWEDFRDVLSRLQVDRPDISLYLYVGSPEYAENKDFCWDAVTVGDQCQQQSKYNDYIRWANEAATLHNEFSIVKGILIDDFIYSLSLYDSDSKLFTPDYLDKIRAKGKSLYPDFRLETIWYLSGITAFHFNRTKDHIDGVHFFYRHIDGNSRKDLDSDRIINELDMFTQAFKGDDRGALMTLSRNPEQPAIAGEIITATGVQVASEGDLLFGYWDNLYSKDGATLYGWARVKVYYDDELVFDQDIMGGERDNTVQVITVPADVVAQAHKNNGYGGSSVKLEVETLKGYKRWSYHINLFPLNHPGPTSWDKNLKGKVKLSHTLSLPTGKDNTIKRYLGVYAGSHSKFDISARYLKNILSHALKNSFIEGITFWETMMNSADSKIFSISKSIIKRKLIVADPIFPLEDSVGANDIFHWEVVPGATFYEIWDDDYTSQGGDSYNGHYKHSWSYASNDITCTNGVCHAYMWNSPTANMTWWVRASNNNSSNFSLWSRAVRVIETVANSTNLIRPSELITNTTNIDFSWNRVSNASWYQLWVNDNNGNIYKHWLKATNIDCWAKKCSFSPKITLLNNGEYKWWVRAWNIKGLGNWSDALSFTVK